MGYISLIADIISLISVGRRRNDEETNSLIKVKSENSIDLYLLLNPLLYWLEFSVAREERLPLFKSIWGTIKDVLVSLPSRVDLDAPSLAIPLLQRVYTHIEHNSPTLGMLKFMDIVLRDIRQEVSASPELKSFFLTFLGAFVQSIPYNLYEEMFYVFDKLIDMVKDILSESVL